MSKKNYGTAGARPNKKKDRAGHAASLTGRHAAPESGATPKAVHEDGLHSSPEQGAPRKAGVGTGHSNPSSGARKRVRG